MSQSTSSKKHCCCCPDHGHSPLSQNAAYEGTHHVPLPRTVKQSFPGSYSEASVQAASKLLASGLQLDYKKVSNDFDDASKATYENIMDILHDISSYDIFILERDATFDGRSGCSDACGDCPECSIRRRARPDTKDLQHLQTALRRLFDLIYQNFFHRILCPRKDQMDDAQMALVTPLHRVFIKHEFPTHKEWKLELPYFERAGSENVKLPLRTNERLPKGCPASLCFSTSQDYIDEFIDRVLCSTQVLHERYSSAHHHTTEVTLTEDICPICDRSSAWLLPALVAPWFIHRNVMKRETLAGLKRTTRVAIPASVVHALKNAPTNFPSFPPPPDPLPAPPARFRRRPRKSPAIIMPNPPLYLGYLLPYYRLPFEPAKNPDPIKHPYSYFLSLDDEMRKTWVQYRAQQTRKHIGFGEAVEKYSPGPWKCGWFSATECGLHAEDWIVDKEKLLTLRNLSSFNDIPSHIDTKPWERLSMTKSEFIGTYGFEAWGKSIVGAALKQVQSAQGGAAIIKDLGELIENFSSSVPNGKGKLA